MPLFEPPVVDQPAVLPTTRGPARDLFKWYDWPRGRSVLKINGAYVTVDEPTSDQINSATEVYQGGHIYTVTQTVADALVAAGYSVS